MVRPRLSPRPVNLPLTSSPRSPSPIPPLASKRDNSILHRPPRTPPRNNHGPISVCRETPPVLHSTSPCLFSCLCVAGDPAATTALDWIGLGTTQRRRRRRISCRLQQQQQQQQWPQCPATGSQQAAARTNTQSKRQQHPQGLRTSLTRSRLKLRYPTRLLCQGSGVCCLLSVSVQCIAALPVGLSPLPPRPPGSVPTQLRPPRRRLSGTQKGQKPALSRACTSRKATRASSIVKRP